MQVVAHFGLVAARWQPPRVFLGGDLRMAVEWQVPVNLDVLPSRMAAGERQGFPRAYDRAGHR